MHWSEIPAPTLSALRRGVVIPAHLLALDAQRRLDVRRQRALTRYYLDAGAGGLAVGVHATQFAIRDVGLYRPVLEQTGLPPLPSALSEGHHAPQLRADLRHPGLKAWRAANVSGPAVSPPAWGLRPDVERLALVRPPLRVLLCTWLT